MENSPHLPANEIAPSRHERRVVRAKRALDLTIAVPASLAALPIILVAAVAIKASSPGPAIYSQTRLGRGQAPFRCHKLRTMHVHTPSVPTHEAKPNHITAAGRFLRKLKIDELPQLWNVVRGEMSIVGPRPCLPTQDELIRHRERLGVFALLPGITGLAQVRGIDMSDPALCARNDGEYLASRSLRLDLRIILQTFTRRV